MTIHFAHMAPPGAMTRLSLVACWMRDAHTKQLVRHWLPVAATQPQPDALATPLCTLLARHAELRAG